MLLQKRTSASGCGEHSEKSLIVLLAQELGVRAR
jgi:hypothetical protein